MGWFLTAKFSGGELPVAIVIGLAKGWLLEAHTLWMPWAFGRIKLETSAAFLHGMGDKYLIMITAEPDTWRFFEQLERYDVVKTVGIVENYFPSGSMKLFQTRGP